MVASSGSVVVIRGPLPLEPPAAFTKPSCSPWRAAHAAAIPAVRDHSARRLGGSGVGRDGRRHGYSGACAGRRGRGSCRILRLSGRDENGAQFRGFLLGRWNAPFDDAEPPRVDPGPTGDLIHLETGDTLAPCPPRGRSVCHSSTMRLLWRPCQARRRLPIAGHNETAPTRRPRGKRITPPIRPKANGGEDCRGSYRLS